MSYAPRRAVILGRYNRTGDSIGFSANSAHATLMQTPANVVVNRIGVYVSVQAGNLDLAIYDDDGTAGNPGTRLVSTGSFACPAAGWREITIPATTIPAGLFWAAIGFSSASTGVGYATTTVFYDFVNQAFITAANTTRSQSSAFPLPNPGAFGGGGANNPSLWVRYVP